MQPINYNLDVVRPLERYQQAVAARQQNALAARQYKDQRADKLHAQGLAERQVALGENQLAHNVSLDERKQAVVASKVEAAQKMQADLNEFSAKKRKTPQDYADLITAYPDIAEPITKAYGLLDDNAKMKTSQELTQVYAAISSGKPEIADKILSDRISAYEADGDADNAQMTKGIRELLKADPESAQTTAGLVLAASDSENFTQIYDSLEKNKRAALEHPQALKKIGAELGLTKAQTKKAIADTNKMSLEAKKTNIEVEALMNGGTSGIVDPAKRFEAEAKLRKEFTSITSDYREIENTYGRIQAAGDLKNSTGDLALIIAFTKLQDPGSVVREGEVALTQSTASKFVQAQNFKNKWVEGETILPEKVRNDLLNATKEIIKVYDKSYTARRNEYGQIADRHNIDREGVLVGATNPAETARQNEAAAPTQSSGAPQARRLRYNPATGALE